MNGRYTEHPRRAARREQRGRGRAGDRELTVGHARSACSACCSLSAVARADFAEHGPRTPRSSLEDLRDRQHLVDAARDLAAERERRFHVAAEVEVVHRFEARDHRAVLALRAPR